MRDAIQHGADMVEFDVQVSKDLVPVVYHEFRLCVQTRSKQGGDIMLDIPVKDLSLAELQGLQVHHPSEKEGGLKSFGNEGEEAHQAFPKLEDILVKLDQHCGFNIEVISATELLLNLSTSTFLPDKVQSADEGPAGGGQKPDGDEPVPGSGAENGPQTRRRQEDHLLLLQPRCLYDVSFYF